MAFTKQEILHIRENREDTNHFHELVQALAQGNTRQTNGDAGHNHNGYPTPATSAAHNALNPMNNLNGINAQATYDTK
ncbi:Protein of unknown function [Cotesia congregata]|uniref:Uncharacterized protein n=1 Tax=Cotesia congregata TaxID=51543 RepID=A0A8J2H7E5_COTCN|nr:Protein of unknown function [Cotesia congregata]